ncbi:antibiotic biosynthesis monooxygenase [Curtobacterium flaccumfaciens]|uniref:putative quinol monooxygenase n=1 Tax=Curtobacterium flaccumfaciens TaxID=2035 RepID=UPI00188D40CF|nr:antibiotic biosynthesis monooxygenase [Curtobacterium flaccumfaciens]MBF4595749.1 antibiotic biosynthesis monooxygenase [Curtobacterium flaccumfaciens]
MIVRVSAAYVRSGAEKEFTALLLTLVAGFPQRYPGLLSHEVLVDRHDPRRVQYVSTWSDEAALVDYAGENWQTDPVTFAEEEQLLTQPLTLHHYRSLPISA